MHSGLLGNHVHFLLNSKVFLISFLENFFLLFGKVSKTTLLEVPSLSQKR